MCQSDARGVSLGLKQRKMELVEQEQFLERLIETPLVSKIKADHVMLGNLRNFVFPSGQSFKIVESEIAGLRLCQPGQSEVKIVSSRIEVLQADDGGSVGRLKVEKQSKIGKIKGMPSIGGLVKQLEIDDSEVSEIDLFGDYNTHDYLREFRFTNSKAEKISLTTLTIAGNLTIEGSIGELELVNVEVMGEVKLDGVARCRIVNGKFASIRVKGPVISLNLLADKSRPFWRSVPSNPPAGPLSKVLIRQFELCMTRRYLPIVETNDTGWRIENLLDGVILKMNDVEVRWGEVELQNS